MVPIQFEYVDLVYELFPGSDEDELEIKVKKFVNVLSVFKHRYSEMTMYKVREDFICPFRNIPVSEEFILNEDQMLERLKDKATENTEE